ncbi:helix-turn-helix transcriptional regulator [Actinomyces sp. B33]|uniref:helix-turn-helix transcriptional regulator n=1 Tax=Actinomyces sp. B33 TaxID=2942131 RepID=UPI002341CE88|nr:helix-turn-helix transcriptional regulator [Actinomyces sp. B33]MDC4233171.1 helix-turn-helix transcriptional regulator [Actinomyces sp. B33]
MRSRRLSGTQGIGAAIREERLERGLTQAELASMARVSREWLSGVERGERAGAELSKVLRVLSALELEIILRSSSEGDDTSGPYPAGTPTSAPAKTVAPVLTTLEATRRALAEARTRGADSTRFARSTAPLQTDSLREAIGRAGGSADDAQRTSESSLPPTQELSRAINAALRSFSTRTATAEDALADENTGRRR